MVFNEFSCILRIVLSEKKWPIGPRNSFLPRRGNSPSGANNSRLPITLGADSAKRWIFPDGPIISACAFSTDRKSPDKLDGRLSPALSNVFGKFDWPPLRDLYDKHFPSPCAESRGDHFISNLTWQIPAPLSGFPRAVSIRPAHHPYVHHLRRRFSARQYGSGEERRDPARWTFWQRLWSSFLRRPNASCRGIPHILCHLRRGFFFCRVCSGMATRIGWSSSMCLCG